MAILKNASQVRTTPLESGSLPERKRKSRSPRKEGYLLGIPGVKLVVKRAREGDADEVRGEENDGGF